MLTAVAWMWPLVVGLRLHKRLGTAKRIKKKQLLVLKKNEIHILNKLLNIDCVISVSPHTN